MPAIATIGTEVTVTPQDDVQIVFAPDKHEFTDDRSPFVLRVAGVMEESGEIIGVFGDVISGHRRYRGQIATLLVRLEDCDWRRDNRSAGNFKVGRSVARPNTKHPFYHPEGTDIEGFPFVIRFGSLDSRSGDEPEVNSAHEAFCGRRAEQDAAPSSDRRLTPMNTTTVLSISICIIALSPTRAEELSASSLRSPAAAAQPQV